MKKHKVYQKDGNSKAEMKRRSIAYRVSLPMLSTHVLEYLIMATFMFVYMGLECLPAEKSTDQSPPSPPSSPPSPPSSPPPSPPSSGVSADTSTDSKEDSNEDSNEGSKDAELRGWSESIYFAITTQTTVGCAGAEHEHAWRVARAIARARCAFLENSHSLTQIWRHHRK